MAVACEKRKNLRRREVAETAFEHDLHVERECIKTGKSFRDLHRPLNGTGDVFLEPLRVPHVHPVAECSVENAA